MPIWMSYLQHGPRRGWGRPYMPAGTGGCGLSPCSPERWSLGSALLCETCLLTYVNELRNGLLRCITAMVSLLRWSGRRLAVCFAEGFRTIGCVMPSSVFRPLANSFRRDAAVRFVDEYLSIPPPRDAELVTKLVRQVEIKSHQSEPMDKAGMDRLLGTGWWRPMPLFAHLQDSKIRLIAVGRHTGHNGHT